MYYITYQTAFRAFDIFDYTKNMVKISIDLDSDNIFITNNWPFILQKKKYDQLRADKRSKIDFNRWMKWNTKIIRAEKGKRSIDETISYHFKIEMNGQIYHHSSITSDQDCRPNIVSLAFALVVSVMCFFLSTIKINLMRFSREVVDKTHEENQIVAKERRRQKKKREKKTRETKNNVRNQMKAPLSAMTVGRCNTTKIHNRL